MNRVALKIALVHNWPGKKNSELDLIGRMRPILTGLGHRPLTIDPIGFVLDDEGCRTSGRVAGNEIDLVLNLHYLNPKMFGRLAYTVNWNPLRYLVDDPSTGKPVHPAHLDFIFNCFRSHDRVLSAGSDELDELIGCVRHQGAAGCDLPTASLQLHTTISASFAAAVIADVQPPAADTARVFYIGANWEKLAHQSTGHQRHAGLFELLDKSGECEFYGLQKQNGVALWDNITSYQGELPFDQGRSILRESARCGISLVLSSSRHIDSAVASTRVFQAFAAGTVVISDRNPFIERHFGDCCYFFDYGRDAAQTSANILAAVELIRNNWSRARARAEQGREIFQQHFDLQHELENVCSQAQKDLQTRDQTLAAAASKTVAIHYLARHHDATEVAQLAQNLRRQEHVNWQLHGYCSLGGRSQLAALLEDNALSADIHTLPRERIAIGQTLAYAGECQADFHLWYTPGFAWSENHLRQLLASADADRAVAVAPLFKHFPDLEAQEEPTAYLINGLHDCYSWIYGSMHTMPGIDNLAAGNIMFAHSVISNAASIQPPLHYFDALALVLLALPADQRETRIVGLAAAVTSLFIAGVNEAPGFRYCEYNYMPQAYADTEARDLRLYTMLLRPEQRQELVAGHSGTDFMAVEETEFYADPRRVRERASYISRHFSLKYYLQNQFRHQPVILKLIERGHSLLAGLMGSRK